MKTRKINTILNNAGIKQSTTTTSSRVRGWSNTSEGFEVVPDVKETSRRTPSGRWKTTRKQTGVYAVIYNNSSHMNNKKMVDVDKKLKEIYEILKEAGADVTLDLEGKHTVYGTDMWQSGNKVIIGDVKILKQDHFEVVEY